MVGVFDRALALGTAGVIAERSGLGGCRISVTTSNGESAAVVSERIRAAFSQPAGATAWCLGGQNPPDAVVGADGALRFLASHGLSIENTDPGLSYTLDGDS